ncbi:Co2+/Mg2+ efflux protein ApaG [Alginatibacterium sediminis]|uniref:Protein ApaG n=2 Tax=Alginatibacterium sediminis TaxID=2164068 RepID=A0A420E8Q1_9ALTE|nr:Co2+/Mg2+ efflux protein ApaG [Alginatibacterium sediminis]
MDNVDVEVKIDIQVETGYLEQHSVEEEQQYAFYYSIRIENLSDMPLQILRRYWLITDGDGDTKEVEGEGVIGKQPRLGPNQHFEYTSSAVIPTEVGVMQGSYTLSDDQGQLYQAEIPAFRLAKPSALH